ncbi:MAG: GntR family transcriptional regulator [Clostridiales bacterium]|jgi:DNA-binding GntR family transcriptional regulator|nr:GntR family transcriptional regulator [Clostridiales bacterium]
MLDITINKKSLSEQIYEDIFNDIFGLRIGLGENLINRELQKRYGVSSTPVRDAINRLRQDGLLVDITRAGAKVVSFDCNGALEQNEIISILSWHALSLAAERADVRMVTEQLRRVIALQRQHVESLDYFDDDHEYHLIFFRASGNSYFCELYKRYNLLQELMIRHASNLDAPRRILAIQQHEEICDAFQKGDTEEACELMKRHYKTAEDLILREFRLPEGIQKEQDI